MTCPHRASAPPVSIACAVLPQFTAIAGPDNPNYPCDRCRSQWTDDTPPDPDDRSTWTPTLLSFVEPLDIQPTGPRGLGDTVATVLAAVGVKKRKGCGCSKRQAWLNRVVPYKKTPPTPSSTET